MPNPYGFNELHSEVACIEDGCGARGFIWDWPEKAQARHHEMHIKDQEADRQRAARRRARDARKLARQVGRENDMAYGDKQ